MLRTVYKYLSSINISLLSPSLLPYAFIKGSKPNFPPLLRLPRNILVHTITKMLYIAVLTSCPIIFRSTPACLETNWNLALHLFHQIWLRTAFWFLEHLKLACLQGLRPAVIEDTYKNIFMCLWLRKQFPKRISEAVLSIIQPLERMDFFQTHNRTLSILMKVHSSDITLSLSLHASHFWGLRAREAV